MPAARCLGVALLVGGTEGHRLQLEPADSGAPFGELMGAVGDQSFDDGDEHRSLQTEGEMGTETWEPL